ncbi:MAG: late competence development ComFB family protein [Spirochaetes bacterium]|nr:late competence development ComFB family protein [Spirochaetota bacterium]
MNLNEIYNFEYLKNEAEELVKDTLAKEMKRDKTICDCQDCILDIVGFTLNNIKPLYKTSLKGGLYTNIPDEKYLEALKKTLKQAIEKIKANPSHN